MDPYTIENREWHRPADGDVEQLLRAERKRFHRAAFEFVDHTARVEQECADYRAALAEIAQLYDAEHPHFAVPSAIAKLALLKHEKATK